MQLGGHGCQASRITAEVAGALQLMQLSPVIKQGQSKRRDLIEAVLASLTARKRVPDATPTTGMYPI